MPSATYRSPQRRRTLDALPMSVNSDLCRNNIQRKRDALDQRMRRLAVDCATSGQIAQRGKRLFEAAVRPDTAPPGLPSLSTTNKKPCYMSPAVRYSTNGPTVLGSPIYNYLRHEDSTLDIPTRPDTASDTPAARVHSARASDFRQFLSESNSRFRVVPINDDQSYSAVSGRSRIQSAYSCSSSSRMRDYLLLPAWSPENCDERESTIGDPDDTSSWVLPVAREGPQRIVTSTPVWDDGDSLSEQGVSPRADTDDVSSTQEGEGTTADDVIVTVPVVTEHRTENVSESVPPAPRKPSRSSRTRRRVTWVDDVTVSSVPPATAPPDDMPQNDTPQPPIEKAQDAKIENLNLELEEARTADAEDELADDIMVLPGFVCPSSEEKSRQVRIKQWLQTTSFSQSCRSVPLL